MRITASFVSTRPRLTLPLVAALWITATVFTALAGWFIVSIFEISAEHPRLQARLERLDEQLAGTVLQRQLPPSAEMESLRQRVATLNKLSGMHGWGTPQLLAWLEGRLPQNVYLVSLHHKPREGEALLVAESSSAEALTALLLKLEKELRSAEVLLSKQGTRNVPRMAAIHFEIRIRWKS